ncbi:hypothetical protein Cni_G00654 [Canna indica]|uniref:Uncharacterized protein n=1 Tax=Canna indica TaxID=4628 RepID=A0AAQ3JMT7_9LILI|nr:hypothetical protein Cni_G00654 [Canna indica]
MEDAVRASERRSLMVQARASCHLPSPADSLLSRLDQFDHRLRQLEEKQRLSSSADCYFTADVQLMAARSGEHHRSNSLSAMHDVLLKKALMDRLHLLETRLRQISFELEKEAGAATNRVVTEVANGSNQATVVTETNEETSVCTNTTVLGRSWKTGVFFKSSAARDPQSQKVKTQMKDLKKAAEKAASAMCQNDKRRAERTRLYRRWLPVGC